MVGPELTLSWGSIRACLADMAAWSRKEPGYGE